MAAPRAMILAKPPARDQYGRPGEQYVAPLNSPDALVDNVSLEKRVALPAFGSLRSDWNLPRELSKTEHDSDLVLAQITPTAGDESKRNVRLVWIHNRARDEQNEFGWAVEYPHGVINGRLTWRFRIRPEDWSPDGWSETCPVSITDNEAVDFSGLKLAYQSFQRGNGVFVTATLVYDGLDTSAQQADYRYQISYPYPDEDYPQIVWTLKAVKGDPTTKRAYGSGWTDLEGNTDHEFYAIRNELALIDQKQDSPEGTPYKMVRYVFRRIPSLATQRSWNTGGNGWDKVHKINVKTHRMDTTLIEAPNPTGLTVGRSISGQTYLRTMVEEVVDRLPPRRVEPHTRRYLYPGVFAGRRPRTKQVRAIFVYDYYQGNGSGEAPITTALPTEWEDNISNIHIYESIYANYDNRVWIEPKYEFWMRFSPIVHPDLTVPVYRESRLVNAVPGGYDITVNSIIDSVSVPKSSHHKGIDRILISDECTPWKGDIWERRRILVPGFRVNYTYKLSTYVAAFLAQPRRRFLHLAGVNVTLLESFNLPSR